MGPSLNSLSQMAVEFRVSFCSFFCKATCFDVRAIHRRKERGKNCVSMDAPEFAKIDLSNTHVLNLRTSDSSAYSFRMALRFLMNC